MYNTHASVLRFDPPSTHMISIEFLLPLYYNATLARPPVTDGGGSGGVLSHTNIRLKSP